MTQSMTALSRAWAGDLPGRCSLTSCHHGVVDVQEKLSLHAIFRTLDQGSWVEENARYLNTAMWRRAERQEMLPKCRDHTGKEKTLDI